MSDIRATGRHGLTSAARALPRVFQALPVTLSTPGSPEPCAKQSTRSCHGEEAAAADEAISIVGWGLTVWNVLNSAAGLAQPWDTQVTISDLKSPLGPRCPLTRGRL